MRILMIHNRYKARGGEDVSTDTQVTLLRDAGHDVVLLEDSNDRIDELGRLRTATRSIWSIEAKRRVASILGESRFDVVHVQNLFPLFSPSIYYAAAETGTPVIQSLRNFRALCPEAMLHRDGLVCTDCVGKRVAWPAIRHGCYQGSTAGSSVVAAMSATHRMLGTWRKRVARYVTPSTFARNVYVDAGWDPGMVTVIPNVVYPDPGAGAGTGGYAVYAGRLAPAKGLETLLEAWASDEIVMPLKIVGEGPRKHLVRKAMESNPKIQYLGPVDPEKVSELVGEAAVAVVPTRGIETFGRAAAEAIARGTPVIAADHGGLSEILVHGENGLLFAPGDVAALENCVLELIASPSRLKEMRDPTRESYLTRFTGERVLNQWLGLYEAVASGPR